MAKEKKKIKIAPLLACIVILALMFAAPYISELRSNTSTDGEDVTVTIEQGSSVREIAQVLKDEGLIKSKNNFLIRVRMSNSGENLNYGTFVLNTGMCIPDIIKTLCDTVYKKETVSFTVPEGFSVEQIASRAESLGLCSVSDFLTALGDEYEYDFLPTENVGKYRLQGFLFPKTYEFFADVTPHEMIDTMIAQFEKEFNSINGNSGKLSFFDTVTLASLIEREALLDDERPRIAGVMYNRLDEGMRLQIDASVVYVITDGAYDVNRVTYADLEVNSPYNTYRVSALPVGPICNPGLTSLKAAINPEKHEYLYYHTDTQKNDGSHIFTKTYEEHLETMN